MKPALVALLGGCIIAQTGCMTYPARPADQRPASWARAVSLTPAVANLHQVDQGIYRSAQLDQDGMSALGQLPVRTVINLRPLHRDPQVPAGVSVVNVPVWTIRPTTGQIVTVLALTTDPARQPVLIHCRHGADRTGLMVAAYRVVVQGWPKSAAIAEMQQGGFGFHTVFGNLPRIIMALDVDRMRQQLQQQNRLQDARTGLKNMNEAPV